MQKGKNRREWAKKKIDKELSASRNVMAMP